MPVTKYIDLRSDTVTNPTPRMRELMAVAVVGDDVYQDDPTVLQLEALSAAMLGKEAAMFVPTGTMGNQVSIMTHTKRGEEIIVHENSHVVFHEVGAIGLLSQCNVATVHNEFDFIFAEDILRKVRGNNIHYPNTSLVCIENALGSGLVIPLSQMKETYQAAKSRGLAVHLDGARIFNAATALGVEAKEIAAYADSVMFCLSKGLCAPVGSMVVGTKEFIHRARKNRKLLGGGMRQSGILAAAGIEALQTMTKRLSVDHDNAKYLANRLIEFPIAIKLESVHINMVYFNFLQPVDEEAFVAFFASHHIKINGSEHGQFRFVTHNDINQDDIEQVIACLGEFLMNREG